MDKVKHVHTIPAWARLSGQNVNLFTNDYVYAILQEYHRKNLHNTGYQKKF